MTYWTAADEESSDFDRDDLEDSDALFGLALSARGGHA